MSLGDFLDTYSTRQSLFMASSSAGRSARFLRKWSSCGWCAALSQNRYWSGCYVIAFQQQNMATACKAIVFCASLCCTSNLLGPHFWKRFLGCLFYPFRNYSIFCVVVSFHEFQSVLMSSSEDIAERRQECRSFKNVAVSTRGQCCGADCGHAVAQ